MSRPFSLPAILGLAGTGLPTPLRRAYAELSTLFPTAQSGMNGGGHCGVAWSRCTLKIDRLDNLTKCAEIHDFVHNIAVLKLMYCCADTIECHYKTAGYTYQATQPSFGTYLA